MKLNKIDLIVKYEGELFKKRSGFPYDEKLIEELEKNLNSINALEEAKNNIKKDIEDEQVYEEATKSCEELFKILKEFSIWKFNKSNNELKQIKSSLEQNDKYYIARIFLFEKLMRDSKFKGLKEREKIKVAMQLGALDFNSLGVEI